MQFIYIAIKVMPRKPQSFVMHFIAFVFLGSKQIQKHQGNRENVLYFSGTFGYPAIRCFLRPCLICDFPSVSFDILNHLVLG